MAFIYKPKNSKTFRIGFKVEGKFKSLTTGTTDYSEAKKFKKDFEAKQRLNLFRNDFQRPEDHRFKLSDALQIFLDQKQLAEKSIQSYKTAVDHLVASSGDKYLFQFSNKDFFKLIDRFKKIQTRTKTPLSKNSMANYSRHLFALFNFLVKENFIKENPIRKIAGERKEVEPIPAADLEKILDHLKKKKMIKQFNLIKLIYLCAFRISEAIRAEVEDFDLIRKTVQIKNEKGKRVDLIPMPDDLYQFLLFADLPKAGRLFNYKSTDSTKSFWKNANDACGLKYSLHQIRKARGTDLANAGVEPLFVQKFMRHNDFRTTQQYYLKIDINKAADDINRKIAFQSKLMQSVELPINLN